MHGRVTLQFFCKKCFFCVCGFFWFSSVSMQCLEVSTYHICRKTATSLFSDARC
jgi:hypothetical protein